MDLRFGRAGTDGAPGVEVGEVLGGDDVWGGVSGCKREEGVVGRWRWDWGTRWDGRA